MDTPKNHFLETPVVVKLLDPWDFSTKATYLFLGAVPKPVKSAVKKAYDNDFSGSDELESYYGKSYKTKLGLIDRLKSNVVGGDGKSGIRGIDLNDITITEEDLEIEPKFTSTSLPDISTSIEHISYEIPTSGFKMIADIDVFPEDRIIDLREKIHAAIGVPFYRNHLFWTTNGAVKVPYKIYADGIFEINIQKIHELSNKVSNISIDLRLHSVRDSLRVDPDDYFLTVDAAAADNNTFYLIDLGMIVNKYRSSIVDSVRDSYRFELLYYGFILKFWPQHSQSSFYDYVASERELFVKYPELAKSRTALERRYIHETAILREIYAYTGTKRDNFIDDAGVSVSIMTVTNEIEERKSSINIRNLFDQLHTTKCMPEIHAYLEHENKRYFARKTHLVADTSVQFPTTMRSGVIIAISLNKNDQERLHKRDLVSTIENEQIRYLFVNILSDGTYQVKSSWNEEYLMNFERIFKVLKQFVEPLISQRVNVLGRYIFNSNFSFPTPNKANTKYVNLSIGIHIKRSIGVTSFKTIREVFERFVQAGIMSVRPSLQPNVFEYAFVKGATDYSIDQIDRVLTVSNIESNHNFYANLTNNTIKQKWDQLYFGRVVRVINRTADIKVEILDTNEHEFNIFYRYIIYLFREFLARIDSTSGNVDATRGYGRTEKRLKKLQELDPDLYNLRKYGSQRVYSILCQKGRQPDIFTDDEVKNMSTKEREAKIKFWNFTTQKPAYYSCPHKNYPYLSFLVGAHPMKYCLPCCKKKLTNVESKKAKINEICLKNHTMETKKADDRVRHVLSYGKVIEDGRMSQIPEGAARLLIKNGVLVGVRQNTVSDLNCGFLFCLELYTGKSISTITTDIINFLEKSNKSVLFNSLIGGELIGAFTSIKKLQDSLKSRFIQGQIFDERPFEYWNELFIEFAAKIYGLYTIYFEDQENATAPILSIQSSLYQEIILGQVDIVFASKIGKKIYPLVVADLSDPARKGIQIIKSVFKAGDPELKVLKGLLEYEYSGQKDAVGIPANYRLYKEFCADSGPTMKLNKKFVNKHGLCHGIEIGICFIPLIPESRTYDNIPVSFDLPKGYESDPEQVARIMIKLEAFVENNYKVAETSSEKIYRYKVPAIANWVRYNGRVLGFEDSNKLLYPTADISLNANVPVVDVPENPFVVNEHIFKSSAPKEDDRHTKLGTAIYNSNLYQLIILEVVNFLISERDREIRQKVIDAVRDLDVGAKVGIGNLEKFNEFINVSFQEYLEDAARIKYQFGASKTKQKFLQIFDETEYNFDRVTLIRIKKSKSEDGKGIVRELVSGLLEFREIDTENLKISNVFIPCEFSSNNLCSARKLIVNQNIEKYVPLLYSDLTNPLKEKYLLAAGSQLWLDFFDFEQIADENIFVSLL